MTTSNDNGSKADSRSVHLIQGGLIMYRAGERVITLRRRRTVDEVGQIISTVVLDEPLYWATAGTPALTEKEVEELKLEVTQALRAEGHGSRFVYRDMGVELNPAVLTPTAKSFRLKNRDVAESEDGISVSLEHRYILEYRDRERTLTLRREDTFIGITFVIQVAILEKLTWESRGERVPVTAKEQDEVLANIREALKEFGAETHFYFKGARITSSKEGMNQMPGGLQ